MPVPPNTAGPGAAAIVPPRTGWPYPSLLTIPSGPTKYYNQTPLNELGTGRAGAGNWQGGLYLAGSNQIPAAYQTAVDAAVSAIVPRDASGNPSPTGAIGFVGTGMSNMNYEFTTAKLMADCTPIKNPLLTVINCAIPSKTTLNWSTSSDNCWTTFDTTIAGSGLAVPQIQVVHMKNVHSAATSGQTLIDQMVSEIKGWINILLARLPNVKLIIVTSRVYAGFSGTGAAGAPPGRSSTDLSPEPFAWESAIGWRQVVLDRVSGVFPVTPVIIWGPYIWANGMESRQDDGYNLRPEQYAPNDMVHPSGQVAGQFSPLPFVNGTDVVAQKFINHYQTDPACAPWFRRNQTGLIVQDLGMAPAVAAVPDYARNIWELRRDPVSNRLHIGYGNSAAAGPNPAAGPIPAIYLDPSDDTYKTDGGFVFDEDQVDNIRLIAGQLVVPGHSTRGSTDGAWYRRESGTWVKRLTLQGATHVYDIQANAGKLIAAVDRGAAPGILVSSDDGSTWTPATFTGPVPTANPALIPTYRLMTVGSQLVYLTNSGLTFGNGIYSGSGVAFGRQGDSTALAMAPGIRADVGKIFRREVLMANGTWVAISTYPDNVLQWKPTCLVTGSTLTNAIVRVLHNGDLPYDLRVDPDDATRLYILAGRNRGANWQATIYASRSSDMFRFVEVASFLIPGLARSFEVFPGRIFYVGAGEDADYVGRAGAGHIYKVTIG